MFTLVDVARPVRGRTARTQENIAIVEERKNEVANVFIHNSAQQLNLYPSTLWQILRKYLCLRAYKIQLNPADHRLHRAFGV